MSNTDPVDPVSPLAELAAAHHELFASYVAAGFTPDQAIYLVGQMVRASASQSPPS
jgi:hypothetical protein